MKQTKLASTVTREMELEGTTLSALAARVGRSQGAMSQLLGKGLRAAPDTMATLSRHWARPGAGARVMIAHLQDELIRAGWADHDYRIEHRGHNGEQVTSQLDKDLDDIRAAASHVPALACLIRDVLAVARADLPADVFEIGRAAESSEKYDTKKGKK
jgi:hypothetical protein